MELKLIDLKNTLTTWLKLHGWVKEGKDYWRKELGPGRSVTASSLGTAVDTELEHQISGSPFA